MRRNSIVNDRDGGSPVNTESIPKAEEVGLQEHDRARDKRGASSGPSGTLSHTIPKESFFADGFCSWPEEKVVAAIECARGPKD